MKLCVNAPKKTVAKYHTLICMILIAVSVVFSLFTPMLKIKIADGERAAKVEDFVYNIAGVRMEIPTETSVSAVRLFSVIGMIRNANMAISTSTDESSANDQAKATAELRKIFLNKDGTLKENMKDILFLVGSFGMMFSDTIEADDDFTTTSSFIEGVARGFLNQGVYMAALFILLILTLIAPIIYILILIISSISLLKNKNNLEVVEHKIARKLPRWVTLPLLFMVLQCATPAITYSAGVALLLMMSLICTVVNVVAFRMHDWNDEDLNFANVAQGISIISVIGFCIFFFSITGVGVFRTFVSGGWIDYVVKIAELQRPYEGMGIKYEGIKLDAMVANGYLIDLALILITSILIIFSGTYLKKALQRLSLSVKRKKSGKVNYSYIVNAAIMVFTVLLPLIVAGMKHNYSNPTEANSKATSFLHFTNGQGVALGFALVGILIVLASEITLIVIQKKLFNNLNQEDVNTIMSGMVKTPEEKSQQVQKVLVNAPVTDQVSATEHSNHSDNLSDTK